MEKQKVVIVHPVLALAENLFLYGIFTKMVFVNGILHMIVKRMNI